MGTLELDLHGAAVRVPSSAQRLLAFTALRRRPLARGYVAGQLWFDSTGERAYPGDVAALTVSGDLLPDWYDEWIAVDRERLRQLRVHALEALCERWTAERRFGEALEAGLAAVQVEPLRESAHRALIGMHLAEGNVVEAVRQYETCKRLMARELGVRPSRLMVGLLDGAAPRARRRLGTA